MSLNFIGQMVDYTYACTISDEVLSATGADISEEARVINSNNFSDILRDMMLSSLFAPCFSELSKDYDPSFLPKRGDEYLCYSGGSATKKYWWSDCTYTGDKDLLWQFVIYPGFVDIQATAMVAVLPALTDAGNQSVTYVPEVRIKHVDEVLFDLYRKLKPQVMHLADPNVAGYMIYNRNFSVLLRGGIFSISTCQRVGAVQRTGVGKWLNKKVKEKYEV